MYFRYFSYRYLHLQASSEAHILLQALIKHYKIQDLGPLIKLFCNEGLLGNLDNFKTLSTICQYSILPEIIVSDSHLKGTDTCHENLRKYLLSWVLNGDEKYPCKDFAKLLVALILKKFHEEMEKNVDRENILITHTNINDFCKVITKNYSTVAFKNVKFIEDSRNGESNPSVRVDSKMKKILVDILKERWKRLLTSLTGTELDFDKQLTVLENCYWFCELLCHLLSNTETINASMINDNVLVDELKLLCRACTEKTLKLIKIKFFDLTALSNLFNVHFHAKVQKIIQEKNVIDLNLLQYLFELFAKYNESQTLNNGKEKNTTFLSISFTL